MKKHLPRFIAFAFVLCAAAPFTCLGDEIPKTAWRRAVEAFRNQLVISGPGPFLFASDLNPTGHQRTLNTAWQKSLRRAGVPYFRIYDLGSTYATRLSAGGVADEWVIQLLRPGDSHIFKKYSQMKLQMNEKLWRKSTGGQTKCHSIKAWIPGQR